jgi:hypothetical protein
MEAQFPRLLAFLVIGLIIAAHDSSKNLLMKKDFEQIYFK